MRVFNPDGSPSRLDPSVTGGKLYTMAEVAELLKVSKPSIWRAVKGLKIGHYRFGPAREEVRIPQTALDSYLERSKTNAPRS